MADDVQREDAGGGENDGAHHTDPENDFIERTAAKYEEADRKRSDAEDLGEEAEGEEAGEESDESGDDKGAAKADGKKAPVKAEAKAGEKDGKQDGKPKSKADGEQANPDKSAANPDGGADESGEDSTGGDESDQPDEESDEGAEGDEEGEADAEDEGEEGEEGDEDEVEGASEEFEAAAAKHGVDLTLDDIEDPTAKKLVQQKIAAMDSGYTRAMQEAREGRKQLLQAQAEQRFREKHPELSIVEQIEAALEKDPKFIEKVQARLDKHHDDADVAKAFKIVLNDTRKNVTDELTAEVEKAERRAGRADAVESLARKLAAEKGLPWRIAEKAIVVGMKPNKDTGEVDIDDDEIKRIIGEEAAAYRKDLRGHRRDDSKQRVKDRHKAKAGAGAAPAKARTAGGAAPKPAASPKKKYDDDDEDSRIEHMMGTARRVMPGKK